MKRIESLIQKLNTQFTQNAPFDQLLVTVQMIQTEINGSMKEVDVLGANGISVIAPSVASNNNILNLGEDDIENSNGKEYFELIVETDESESETRDEHVDINENSIPTYEEMMREKTKPKSQASLNFNNSYNTDSEELPTLARQTRSVAKAAKQAATPRAGRNSIKDLNKAINAKDRMLYIKELFRGDEMMFDRSIKTINNFNTFAEADYWIMRELKTKNGWLPGDAVVQQFEQLIRRRFV